jgi:cytochrome c-type biogenesis protein CcmH
VTPQYFVIAALSMLAGFAVIWWLVAPLRHGLQTQKAAALGLLALVPLLASGTYMILGQPSQPDQPLAPRLEGDLNTLPPGAILVRLEQKLRANPDDAEGWRLLARLRDSLNMHDLAADAWQRVIALGQGDSEARASLAQALIEIDAGVVSEVAVALLDDALALDETNMMAQFWRGVAHQQQGEAAKARALWQALRDKLPDGIPLSRVLDQRLQSTP